MKTISRFAPSPTGRLHAGNYRSALFAYLYTKKNGGEFKLRIEDTDKERSKKEYEDDIIEALAWLGLDYSEKIIQTENAEKHREFIERLIAEDKAYISKEEPAKEGGRTEVIRFRNPNGIVKFNDLIRGEISFDTSDLKDFVIAKSLDEPIFHFAVVIDDHLMGINTIVRGEDHISNTPRQILIQQALGIETPIYAHLPMVLAKDRTKLSKRKGALPVTEYRKLGYLPSALLNYMALVGWNPGTEQEIFTLPELIDTFDLAKVQKSGAIFDEVKLDWMNKEHMGKLNDEEFLTQLRAYMQDFSDARTIELFESLDFEKVKDLIRNRMNYFGEIKNLLQGGELAFIEEAPVWTDRADLLITPEKMRKNGAGQKVDVTRDSTKIILNQVLEILAKYEDEWNAEKIKETVWSFAEHEGRGVVLWPLRVSLSGREKSADPFSMAYILGKEETLKRIADAVLAL